MATAVTVVVLVVAVALILLALSVRIVKQYEQGVLFQFGRVLGVRQPGFPLIVPFVDVMQLRNSQTLVDIGVDKNTTVVFPAPLMSTIGELGSFLAGETAAAQRGSRSGLPDGGLASPATANGSPADARP